MILLCFVQYQFLLICSYYIDMTESVVHSEKTDWTYVNYKLQLILAHPNVRITKVSRNQNLAFDSSLSQYIATEAAVDISTIDEVAIQNIKNNGTRNVVFKSGRIGQKVQIGQSKRYRMLMCKIMVNQILPVLRQDSLKAEDFFGAYPDYDTIYLASRKQQLNVFVHDYILRRNTQYQWQFDVEYIYTKGETQNDFQTWKAEDYECQTCRSREAKFYCAEDREIFCNECFGELHRSERKSKHKRESISAFNCTYKCDKPLHQNERLQHYCFDCRKLKCKHCLSDVLHGRKEDDKGKNVIEIKNDIKMHEVMQTRQLALMFKEQEKQLGTEAKERTLKMIKQLQKNIQRIGNHYDLQIKEIQRSFTEKIVILKEETAKKLNRAVGLHTQLKRKYDEMIWVQQFGQYIDEIGEVVSSIKVKQGLSSYMVRTFNAQYFNKLEKRISEIKTFS